MNFLIFTPIILVLLAMSEILVYNEEVLLSLCFFTFIYFCFNQYNLSIYNSSLRFKASVTKPMLKDILTNYQVKGSSIQLFQSSTMNFLLALKYSCSLDTTFLIKDTQLSNFLLNSGFTKNIFSNVYSYPWFLNINSNFSFSNSIVGLSSQFTIAEFNFIISLLSFIKPTKKFFSTY